MLKEKLEELGIIFSKNYLGGPSYIFPDGSYLNVTEQVVLGNNLKKRSFHGQIDNFISEHHLAKDIVFKAKYRFNHIAPSNLRILAYTDNAITINDGYYFNLDGRFISLPPKKLSAAQVDALTLLIDDLHYKNIDKLLNIDLKDQLKVFDLKLDSTDEIIKEINKLYNLYQDEEEKICKIILAFNSLGKTYFCQHNLRYIDLEEDIFYIGRDLIHNLELVVDAYLRHGYNVVLNLNQSIIRRLKDFYSCLNIYLPDNTEESKKRILDDIEKKAKNNYTYSNSLNKHNYDKKYAEILSEIRESDNVIYIPADKYLSDVLKKD